MPIRASIPIRPLRNSKITKRFSIRLAMYSRNSSQFYDEMVRKTVMEQSATQGVHVVLGLVLPASCASKRAIHQNSHPLGIRILPNSHISSTFPKLHAGELGCRALSKFCRTLRKIAKQDGDFAANLPKYLAILPPSKFCDTIVRQISRQWRQLQNYRPSAKTPQAMKPSLSAPRRRLG